MTQARWLGWLLALGALSATPSALAAEAPSAAERQLVHLSYVAPTQCPLAATLQDRVSRLTARVGWVEASEATKQLSIRLVLDARGARGSLSMSGEGRRPLVRQLQAASCTELAEALAIIVALIFDPDAQLEPPAESAPPPRPKAVVPASPAEARREPLHARFMPELFVLVGPTPSASVGGALGVGVVFLERSPFELAVRMSGRATLEGALATPYGTAHFAWRALSLELCPLGSPSRRLLRAEACLALDAGQIVASADSDPHGEAKRTWLAPGAALHASVNPLNFLALEATAALSVPLLRDRFLLAPFAIHQPAAVAFRTGLALSVQFF